MSISLSFRRESTLAGPGLNTAIGAPRPRPRPAAGDAPRLDPEPGEDPLPRDCPRPRPRPSKLDIVIYAEV